MVDTGTSKKATCAKSEAAIRAMRTGGAAEGEKPKKSKKKLVLVALLVLLLGGGAAGYKFMLADTPEMFSELPAPEPEVIEPEELYYINLGRFLFPFKPTRVPGTNSLSCYRSRSDVSARRTSSYAS